MKKFAFLALAIVVAFAAPAFAEVQNVKVGGDITAQMVKCAEYDLTTNTGSVAGVGGNNSSDHYFMTTTRIYVAADLTDNVQAYIRVINERDWDAADNTATNDSASSDENDINIDLSYIKLSEFLYSPLTLTIGRQEIFWGSGLVVGDSYLRGNLNLRNVYLTSQKAFDAVRATLDYDPWTVDMFWARIDEDENAFGGNDEEDEDLAGINVSYVWPSEWLTEAYYVFNSDSDSTNAAANQSKYHTFGARAEGAVTPIDEKLYVEGEIAYQTGDWDTNRDLEAWAAILGATYEFDNEYKPVLGLKYDFREGDEFNKGGNPGSADYENWNAPYNDYAIGSIINKIWTDDFQGSADPRGMGGNIHAFTTSGSFMPFEDVEVALDWVWAKADEEQIQNDDDEIGNEFIGTVTYDYTEDVTLSIFGSYFDPGDAFRAIEDDEAYEIISSVSVEF